MKTVREVLNTIKKIKGISTDDELAKRIGVPVHTMRSWIQNDSIRKQLMRYCFDNNISIDEVFFGEQIFSKDRCEKCQAKKSCPVYRKREITPVTVEEVEKGFHISINVKDIDQFKCDVYHNHVMTSNLSMNTKDLDRILIELQKNIIKDTF